MELENAPESQGIDLRSKSRKVKYVTKIEDVRQISADERERLGAVTQEFVFRANDYYLGLIDWEDPQDPIKQLIIPREDELSAWGELDASDEASVTVAPGVQHKYLDTALLLCNEVCGAYCRYCFRKRLFMEDNNEVSRDVSLGLEYIANHPEINNVLLTGGDPLLMSPRRLGEIFEGLRKIPHVKIVRIGSKMPAFDPWRILGNTELQAVFRKYSTASQRIYLMAHFDHPRELTEHSVGAIDAAIKCGVICVNQCPLIAGVNDCSESLHQLYEQLSFIGCPPYYLFQGRPTKGNEPYEVPLVRGWQIHNKAISLGSGLARRSRFVMSHETGKIQMVGLDESHIYLRYHEAKDPNQIGKFMVFQRDDKASWFDDLVPVNLESTLV